jgi:hypothetical protein
MGLMKLSNFGLAEAAFAASGKTAVILHRRLLRRYLHSSG